MSLAGKTLAQMWPNWCHQLCRKNRPFHVQKLLPHCHFVKWPPTGMTYQKFMACAQKDNKTNGNETQTWQKDLKSFAKRITPQNPQTSKCQKGNAATFNYPPGVMILPTKIGADGKALQFAPLKTTIYPWIMSIPARNSRGFHLVFHPKSGFLNTSHRPSAHQPRYQLPTRRFCRMPCRLPASRAVPRCCSGIPGTLCRSGRSCRLWNGCWCLGYA